MVFNLFSYKIKKVVTYYVSFGNSFVGNAFPHSDVRFTSFEKAISYCEEFISEFLKKYENSEDKFEVRRKLNKNFPSAHFQVVRSNSLFQVYSIDVTKSVITILS